MLDPQGKAVAHGLESMGFKEVKDVRVGKFIEVDLNTQDKGKAEQNLKVMCEKLLANTVIEDYKYEIL